MINLFKNNNGQTLVEAATALGVASIIIAAIAIAIITSMNNATFSKNQNLATQYAQQGMDMIRQLSDSNWQHLHDDFNGDYCFPSGDLNLNTNPCTTPNLDGIFIRKLNIQTGGSGCSSDSKKATVTVLWSDGKCQSNDYCHNVKLESCFAGTNSVTWP